MGPPALWEYSDLTFGRLIQPPSRFDCGSAAQTDFLLHEALPAQVERLSATYLGSVRGMVFGYATLACDSLETYTRERPKAARGWPRIPALKILQMGVDVRFQGIGLGSSLVQFSVLLAGQPRDIPFRFVTLDAVPERAEWYRRRGFTPSKLRQKERIARVVAAGGDPTLIPVSMHYDLDAAGPDTEGLSLV